MPVSRDSTAKSLVGRLCLLLVVVLADIGGAQMPDPKLEAAVKAFVDSRYIDARRQLEPLAEAGRSQAQYLLGVIHERGYLGVDADLARAQSWYLRSQRLHHDDARKAAERLARRLDARQQQEADRLAEELRIVLEKEHACMSFSGEPFIAHYVELRMAQPSVVAAVQWILDTSGDKKNFEIHAANVPNVAAVVHQGRRLLLYNPGVFDEIRRRNITVWSAYGLLAYQVGHHVRNHTFPPEGDRESIEREADAFAGFVLARMGASLAEARAAVERFVHRGSGTHAGRTKRIDAVTQGWREAQAQSPVQGVEQKRPTLPPQSKSYGTCNTTQTQCNLTVSVPDDSVSVCYCSTGRGWISGYSD